MNFDWSDHPFLVMGLLLLLMGCGVAGLVALINRIGFPAELARIEQVRADVQKVDAAKAEDVIGQAVDINQTIAAMQQYNRMPWSDWAIPDGWNDIKLIEIEKEKAK
jgi:hypothetical protein